MVWKDLLIETRFEAQRGESKACYAGERIRCFIHARLRHDFKLWSCFSVGSLKVSYNKIK